MTTDERRREIISILKKMNDPITGTELSKKFGVSRQVIVQDIAVIRAEGYNILATSNGYLIPIIDKKKRNIQTIVCSHEGYDEIKEELTIMVDMGAKILDVIVDHPVYGEIRSSLMIGSRMDIEDFMEKVKKSSAQPLSSLTGGEHIHTIEVPSNRAYERIIQKLKEKGYLLRE